MKTGKVKLVMVLTRPDETIVREEPVKFEKDEQLTAYVLMILAKIRSEGGDMTMHTQYDMELIPIERIVSCRATGTVDLIQDPGDGNVNEAIAAASLAKQLDAKARGGR